MPESPDSLGQEYDLAIRPQLATAVLDRRQVRPVKSSPWPKVPISQVVVVRSGGTPRREEQSFWAGGSIPWVTTSEVVGSVIHKTEQHITQAGLDGSSAKLFPAGTVLVAMYGQGKTRGQVGILGIEAATNQACAALLPNDQMDSDFLFQFLDASYEDIRKLSNSGGQDNLSVGLVGAFQVPIPPIAEQRRIARILSTWSEAIAKLSGLHRSLLTRRAWLRNNVVSGKMRLEGHEKPWSTVRLADVLFEHRDKSTGQEEVFSVSVHKGLVNQVEHLGRSFAAEDTSRYNVVRPGDVVYTKSPTGEFPLGIIKQSTVDADVIVSPLYGVFTPSTRALGAVLDSYFESPIAITNYLQPLVQKGAKNTISITNRRFLEGMLPLPDSPDEQQAIASLMETSSVEIKLIQREINVLRLQKRVIMQKLMTGEIRVNTSKEDGLV